MIKTFLLIFISLLPTIQNQSNANPPLILFERIYENPKDAFQIRGETIDSKGRIHSFNNRNNKPGVKYRNWNLGKKDALPNTWEMTAAEVANNLSVTDSVIGVVHPDTLIKYTRLLAVIAESNKNYGSTLVVCRTVPPGVNTASGSVLYGFIYEPGRNMYKRIRIEEHGGIEWQNQSQCVNELQQWEWSR